MQSAGWSELPPGVFALVSSESAVGPFASPHLFVATSGPSVALAVGLCPSDLE